MELCCITRRLCEAFRVVCVFFFEIRTKRSRMWEIASVYASFQRVTLDNVRQNWGVFGGLGESFGESWASHARRNRQTGSYRATIGNDVIAAHHWVRHERNQRS
jgi:hypothetical protein